MLKLNVLAHCLWWLQGLIGLASQTLLSRDQSPCCQVINFLQIIELKTPLMTGMLVKSKYLAMKATTGIFGFKNMMRVTSTGICLQAPVSHLGV